MSGAAITMSRSLARRALFLVNRASDDLVIQCANTKAAGRVKAHMDSVRMLRAAREVANLINSLLGEDEDAPFSIHTEGQDP